MDLVILEKIGPSILNGLGYIVHLEKKNGSKITLNWVILPEKQGGARRAALAAVFVSSKIF